MSAHFPKGWRGTGLYSIALLILCHDSTGCDETDDHFAIEADRHCEGDLNKDCF